MSEQIGERVNPDGSITVFFKDGSSSTFRPVGVYDSTGYGQTACYKVGQFLSPPSLTRANSQALIKLGLEYIKTFAHSRDPIRSSMGFYNLYLGVKFLKKSLESDDLSTQWENRDEILKLIERFMSEAKDLL